MGMRRARRHRRHRIRRASAVFVVLMGASAVGSAHSLSSLDSASDPYAALRLAITPDLTHLERRVGAIEADGQALAEFHATRIAPLVEALDNHMAIERSHLERIAIALIREGRATGIDPRLLAAVMLVENPWLDLSIQSFAGAVGLMQVMPFHAGNWGCPGVDLTDLDANICHGARILADALRRSDGDLHEALLRYNGCVAGANTPNCHEYPSWVFDRAGPDWMTDISLAFATRVAQAD